MNADRSYKQFNSSFDHAGAAPRLRPVIVVLGSCEECGFRDNENGTTPDLKVTD